MSDQVQIKLGVKTDTTQLKALQDQFLALGKVAAGFLGFKALKDFVSEGVSINAQLEKIQLGMAGILRQFEPAHFQTFQAAMGQSAAQIEKLREAAKGTGASFEDLVKAYQKISAGAFAAGIPMEKQIGLTLMLNNALASIGLSTEDMPREARSLFSGQITRRDKLAKASGMTEGGLQNAKASGQLLEYITAHIGRLAESGRYSVETYTGRLNKMHDALNELREIAGRDAFAELKKSFQKFTEAMSSPQAIAAAERLGKIAGGVVAAANGPVGEAGVNVAEAAGLFYGAKSFGGLALKSGNWIKGALGLGGATTFGSAVPLSQYILGGAGALAAGLGLPAIFGTKFALGQYAKSMPYGDSEDMANEPDPRSNALWKRIERQRGTGGPDLFGELAALKRVSDELQFQYQERLIKFEQYEQTKRRLIEDTYALELKLASRDDKAKVREGRLGALQELQQEAFKQRLSEVFKLAAVQNKAAMDWAAPQGMARSGIYTSFGSALIAQEGLSIQRQILTAIKESTAEAIRTRQVVQSRL